MWILFAALSASVTVLGSVYLAITPEAPPFQRCLVSAWGALACLLIKKAASTRYSLASYGSAAFARPAAMRDMVLPRHAALPPGSVLLGSHRGVLLALPMPYTSQHGLIVGGSGTGKSFSFFLPNMALARGVSCIATDPKSELWTHTSGWHRATRYAPTEPEASAGFNWIPLCQDPRMASLCARAVVEAGATERQAAPWPDLETAFLAALFSHAGVLSVPTPLTAYRLLTENDPDRLIALFLASPSPTAREQAVIFQQTHERLRGSITPVIAAKLQFLRDPDVARFTSATCAVPDFGRLRWSPEAIYWCVREQDLPLLRPLSSLFFTVLLEQLAQERPVGKQAVPAHLYFDEFANIGVIPHYDTTISLARGRGLSIWHGIQSLSQLEARYGRANAQTIVTNCATKIALSGLDVETAEYFSRTLGETTAMTPRRTWQRRRFALMAHSASDTVQPHARPLLTPDEVRRIASRQALVIAGNRPPMLLDKYVYDRHPHTAQATSLGAALSIGSEVLALDGDTPGVPHDVPSKAVQGEAAAVPVIPSGCAEPFRLVEAPAEVRRRTRSRIVTVSKVVGNE